MLPLSDLFRCPSCDSALDARSPAFCVPCSEVLVRAGEHPPACRCSCCAAALPLYTAAARRGVDPHDGTHRLLAREPDPRHVATAHQIVATAYRLRTVGVSL